MSSKGKLRIVVLFDHELRIAAKATKAVVDATKEKRSSDVGELLGPMVQACHAALFHLEEARLDEPLVVLASNVILPRK